MVTCAHFTLLEATDVTVVVIWPGLGLSLRLPHFFGQLIHSHVLAFAQQRDPNPAYHKATTRIPVLCRLWMQPWL